MKGYNKMELRATASIDRNASEYKKSENSSTNRTNNHSDKQESIFSTDNNSSDYGKSENSSTNRTNNHSDKQESIFSTDNNSSDYRKSENSSTNRTSIEDDSDDGNVNFKTAFKSFASGMIDNAKGKVGSVIDFAKREPVLAGCVGATGVAASVILASGAMLCPPVGIAAGVAMAGYGGYNLIKDFGQAAKAFNNYKNASTDDEAKQALHNLGYEAADGVLDVAEIAAGAASVSKSAALHSATKAAEVSRNLYYLNGGTSLPVNNKLNIDAVADYLIQAEAEKNAGIAVGVGTILTETEAGSKLANY